MLNHRKVLILRFSAFGDIVQSLSLPSHIKSHWSDSEVHWVTRSDFSPLLQGHPNISKIFSINKKDGFRGILRLIAELRREKYTHIYDAHNNLRSRLICLGLIGQRHKLLRRSLLRMKRLLLFRFRKNIFEMPFSGQRDLLKPLEKWGIPFSLPPAPQLFISNTVVNKAQTALGSLSNKPFIALAPSAAHYLKRWPEKYWKTLISENQSTQFVILGGPEDRFISNLIGGDEHHAVSLAGKLSLIESAAVVGLSQGLIANDTGLLHVAEQLGVKAIALMGPAPFGFPSRRDKTLILEKNLACRPCSKHGQGPCRNSNYQECLTSITPEFVGEKMREHIEGSNR